MKTRAISGIIFIFLCWWSLVYPGGHSYLIFGLFISAILWEAGSFSLPKISPKGRLLTLLVFLPLFFSLLNTSWKNKPWVLLVFAFLFLLSFLANLWMKNTRFWLLLLYFLTPFFFLLSEIKLLEKKQNSFLLFLLIWGFDVFSYLGGYFFGKTRPFKKLSPQKSIEGYLSGLVFLGSCSIFLKEPLWVPVVVALGASIGDLYISFLKRRSGLKDSGMIMPGHGGLMDRFDSFTITYMVYYFINYFWNN